MNETKTIRVYSDIPNVESFLNNLKQNKSEYENVQFEIIGLDQRENVLFNLNYDVVDLIIVDHATAKKLYQNCGEDIALITDLDTSPYQGSYLDDHLTEESSLYALPFTKNVAVLYVNDDLISLEEGAETSWSQFEEGQDLYLNGDNQSNTYAFFKPTNGEARILAYSTGNNLFNEESDQILTEGANKALTHIKNLNQAGLICPHPQDDYDQISSLISEDKVAFIIGCTEQLNWLSQFEQAQFSAHPLPKNDDFVYDVDLGGFDIVIPAFLSEDDRAFVNQLALDMATGAQAVIAIGDELKLIPALAQESELDSFSGITNFNQNVIKFMHGLVYGENTFHPQTSTKEYEIIQAFNGATSTIFEYNYSGVEAADVLYDSVERIINPPVATENTAVNIVNATNEAIYNSTATANAQTGEEIVIDLTVDPNGYSNISEAKLQLHCENTACEDCSLPVYTRTVNEQNEQQDRLIGYTKQSQDGNFTLIDLSGVIKEINEQTTFKMVIKGKDNQTLQVATQKIYDFAKSPHLAINYVDDNDLNENNAYVQFATGHKTMGKVNVRNGKHFLTAHLYTSKKPLKPMDLYLVQNSKYVDYLAFDKAKLIAKGFKLSCLSFLLHDKKARTITFFDEAFCERTYKLASTQNGVQTYFDATGKSGTLITYNSTTKQYQLTDGIATTLTFNENGLLTEQKIQTGASTYITTYFNYTETDSWYNLTSISYGNKNATPEYTFDYSGTSVTVKRGGTLIATAQIENGRLTKITYALDQSFVEFNYEDNKLTAVTDSECLKRTKLAYFGQRLDTLTDYALTQTSNGFDELIKQRKTFSYGQLKTVVTNNVYLGGSQTPITTNSTYCFALDGDLIYSYEGTDDTNLSLVNFTTKKQFEKNYSSLAATPYAVANFGNQQTNSAVAVFNSTTETLTSNQFTIPALAIQNVYGVDLCVVAKLEEGTGNAASNTSITATLQQLNDDGEATPLATAELNPSLNYTQFAIAPSDLKNQSEISANIVIQATNYSGKITVEKASVTPRVKGINTQMTEFRNPDLTARLGEIDNLIFTVGDKVYSNVAFTARDSMLTLISYMKNSQCFNLWYNDGNNVVLGIDIQNLNFSPTLASIFGFPIVKRIYKNESITKYEYVSPIYFIDNKCDLEFITKIENNPDELTKTTTVLCNSLLQKVRASNSDQLVTNYTYDNYGNVIKEQTLNGTDENNIITATYTYDTNGNMLTSTQYRGNQTLTTTYTYDSEGVLTAITAPNGQTYNYGYDSSKQKLTSFSSTLNGTAHTNGISYQNGEVYKLTHNSFDTCIENNRLQDVCYNTIASNSASHLGYGYMQSVGLYENQEGNAKGSYYVKHVYDNGYVGRNVYDKYGHLVIIQVKQGSNSNYRTVLINIYNDADLPLEQIKRINNPFDEQLTISKNSKLRRTIDFFIGMDYNEDTDIGRYEVQRYEYNSLGQLKDTHYYIGDILIRETELDKYNRFASAAIKTHLCEVVNTVKEYKNFASNEIIEEEIDVRNAYTTFPQSESYTYKKFNVNYQTDGLERPTKTTVLDKNNNGYSTTYEYYDHLDENNDKVGTTPFVKSVTLKTVTNGVESSPQVALVEYDSAGNITKYGNNEYAYDNLNRLVTEHNADLNKSYIYEYNVGGNLTAKKEYAYNNIIATPLNQTSFTYNFGNWKDQLSRVKVGNESAKALTYDELGNVKTFGNKSFTYERGNKLKSIANGNQTVSFLYDITGQRTSKTVGNTKIEYAYVGNKLLCQFTEPESLHFAYTANNDILGFRYNSGVFKMYTYRKNIFGDVIGIYDANNTCVAKYVYDAWGNHKVLNPDGTENTSSTFIGNVNPIRYRGYYYDVETGLYYCNSRYYSPELCRFISPDSFDYLDPKSINGLNLYAYCYNNPIMYYDPSGHFAWLAFLGVVAISAIFGAIDGGITASMSGQSFWKGFAAGVIGGTIGGVINYFLPGAGNLLGRAVNTMVYNITNEIFQTGEFNTNNLGLYIVDMFMDIGLSMLYLDKVSSITNGFLSATIGGVIDSCIDVLQTEIYFSPKALQRMQLMYG